ncbi:MAG: hypothetical protein K2G88_06040 [Oscillospiraceae bacterium]|nr:hypothetical protein [Oscillospiraceae bacterium]
MSKSDNGMFQSLNGSGTIPDFWEVDMKIKNVTISRDNFECINATVNNKTESTSQLIVTNLSCVLLEMLQKQAEQEEADEQ